MERPILFSGEMVKSILAGRKGATRRVLKPQPLTVYKSGVFNGDEKNFVAHCQFEDSPSDRWVRCPYGKPGDTLWVREAWRVGAWSEDGICLDYRADNFCRKEWLKVPDEEQFDRLWMQSTEDAVKAELEPDECGMYFWPPGQAPTRWRPAIFMPRWASRLSLNISRIRVERLQDISADDAIAEGLVSWPSEKQQGLVYYGINLADIWETDPRLTYRRLWDSINTKPGRRWDDNPWVWVIEFPQWNQVPGVEEA